MNHELTGEALWTLLLAAPCTGHVGTRRARLVFPDRATGYVTAAGQLRAFAWNNYTARSCRVEGKIQSALCYERICESIYKALPDFARDFADLLEGTPRPALGPSAHHDKGDTL